MPGNLLLYAATVLIWGSTWYAITFQLGVVDPALSIAYRFGLAALLLFAWLALTGRPVRLTGRDLGFAALLGLLLFSANYWLIYRATGLIPSGLVAVVHSTVSVMNVLNSRLVFGQPMRPAVLGGAVIGVAGIALLFLPELRAAGWGGAALLGLVLVLAGTYSASLGNMVGQRNARAGLALFPVVAWGMAFGAAFMAAAALAGGAPLRFDASFPYVASLLYLAVFGSIVAFACYLTLLGRIGADRAGYAAVLFPLVALLLSTAFEGYRLTAAGGVGIVLVLLGNMLVLIPDRWWRPSRRRPALP